MDSLTLAPYPRHVERLGGTVSLPRTGYILAPRDLLFAAEWIQPIFPGWQVTAAAPADEVRLRLTQDAVAAPQSYTLHITPDEVSVVGRADGIFYGLCTLQQLHLQYGQKLPALRIKDAPDFLARGVMLDISRDKVPTMQTLFQLVDLLASLKINQLQLYTEHTFAYPSHPAVWANASPITPQQVMQLDRYCEQRHITLVPNQNSLGHMERWLAHSRYQPLAERPDGFTMPNTGEHRPPSTLNPLDTDSLALVRGLYAELLPHFRSELFNVGGDEPWELGTGKSKPAVDERGGRVYLEWLQKLHALVRDHDRRMMFWGDIIVKYPDLIPELPADAVALAWGYEATHPFAEQARLFAECDRAFYVCPGTSSWNALVGRVSNAVENLRNAAEQGHAHHADGYLITDWGDNGHWQPLPVSYPGFVYGAAVSWGVAANTDIDLAAVLNQIVFQDSANVMGGVLLALGNLYQQVGPPHINGQVLAYALQWPREQFADKLALMAQLGGTSPDVSPETLQTVIKGIDAALARLALASPQINDGQLVTQEITQAAALLRYSAERLMEQANLTDLEALVQKQRTLWLARNRVDGLHDSLHRFPGSRQQ